MPPTCPYCRESIAPLDLAECPTCHTPHHGDCWAENGGCTVFGCPSAPVDDPKIAVAPQEVGSPAAAPAYYLSRHGQTEGPYPLETLREQIYRGLTSREDLACAEGSTEWAPLAQVLAAPQPTVPAAATPYLHPETELAVEDPCAGRARFGRLAYVLTVLAGCFVGGTFGNSPETAGLGGALIIGTVVIGAVFRLRDVGMSGWSVLLGVVPILNLYIMLRALLAPRGYAITKRADLVYHLGGALFLILVAFGVVRAIMRSS